MEEIIFEVTAATGVSTEVLLSRNRSSAVARPRQLCMYLGVTRTNLSPREIAAELRRDRSTLYPSVRQIEHLLWRWRALGDVRYRDLHVMTEGIIERLSNRAQVLRSPGRAVPLHPVPIPRRAASS